MARPEVEPATDDPVRLLHADEEHLRLAAITLRRGGRLVLSVIEHRLWPAALQFLRELLPNHRFVERAPTSSDEANQAISDPHRNEPELTIVIRIDGQGAGVTETLNLRRENLVKAPANFLVVLDGEETHNRFLREAPDCYSYRDLLIALEGDPAFDRPSYKGESDTGDDSDNDHLLDAAIAGARQEPDLQRKARLLSILAGQLAGNHQIIPAREILDEVIAIVMSADRGPLGDEDRRFIAELYRDSAFACSRTEASRRLRAAHDILAPAAQRYPEQFAEITAQAFIGSVPDPEHLLDISPKTSSTQSNSSEAQRFFLAQEYIHRENIPSARITASGIDLNSRLKILRIVLDFWISMKTGAWLDAANLISSRKQQHFFSPRNQDILDGFHAELLMRQGEGRAAKRIYDKLPQTTGNQLALIRQVRDAGQIQEARARLELLLERPWKEFWGGVDDLLAIHRLLIETTEQDIETGAAASARDPLDSRLAALGLYVDNLEPDPPWDRINVRILQADAYLRRSGAESPALSCAEQAWAIAEGNAPILAPAACRRCIEASLRMGDPCQAEAWLSRGLARAQEYGLRGDEVHLRGLALWTAALANRVTVFAETDLWIACDASGSKLVEASTLARVGTALGRHDILRRAQRIYRSLPWPAREGACLEALGENRIAETRYRAFGLITRSRILARRSGPPPLAALDDE